jgi:1-acyl-sn-glycerol-3-phosphate acyltransferase
MDKVLSPVYFVYKLWIGAVFWSTLLALFPFFWILLYNKTTYPQAFQLKRFWSWLIRTLIFCPVVVKNKDKFPNQPFIVTSNHISYLDTVFMYALLERYFLFIGKAELLKWPLFSLFFKKQDIPVHRGNPREAFLSLKLAGDALQRGENIAIYPEGTIPDEAPEMRPFKTGAFKLAIAQQVPVVPIVWHNNHQVMLDPSKLFSYSLPRMINVTVLDPISTIGLTEADVVSLRDKVFGKIQACLKNED